MTSGLPKVVFGAHSLESIELESALTIGAFDGVHLGHQAIIKRLSEKAAELGVPAVALTFYPDPARAFSPRNAPAQIMSFREKVLSLLEAGVDSVVCLRFDDRLKNMSALDFVQKVLQRQLGAKWLLIGDDFRFGLGRSGDFEFLAENCEKYGFQVERTSTKFYDAEGGRTRISSTQIRRYLAAGRFDMAEQLLGKPYEMSGRVVSGKKLGRELGYPTANIQVSRDPVAISGVFAVRVKTDDAGWLDAVANLGYRPAVNSLKKPLLEVHIFDFSQNIYGKRIRVRFLKKIRDEENFENLEALTSAIKKDAEDARAVFAIEK